MHSAYIKPTIDATARCNAVKDTLSALEKEDFDCIAVRGSSGLSIGSVVAYVLGKNLALIRKDLESSHTSRKVETPDSVSRFVIVDDFTSSGETLCHIYSEMKTNHPNAICVGYVAYKVAGEMLNEEWILSHIRDFKKSYCHS